MIAVDEHLWTVDEIAAQLRVSKESVRRWLRTGRLRGIRLAGTRLGYRVRESELRRFIEESEQHPDTENQP